MSPIEKQLFISTAKLLPVALAAKYTPYSAEYLSLLARKGRLKAVKISRDWLTTKEAVLEYTKKQVEKHKKIISSLRSAKVGSGGYSKPVVLEPLRACYFIEKNHHANGKKRRLL